MDIDDKFEARIQTRNSGDLKLAAKMFNDLIKEYPNDSKIGGIQLGAVSNEASSKISIHHESEQKAIDPSSVDFAEDAKEAYQEMEDLISRLKVAIGEGIQKQLPKQNLSQNIKSLLKKYSSLKTSTFRAAIIELICGLTDHLSISCF